MECPRPPIEKLLQWHRFARALALIGGALLFAGCSQEESYVRVPGPTNSIVSRYEPKNFFEARYQNEAAAQVSQLLADLVEMSYFSVKHAAIPSGQLHIGLTERTNSTYRHPTYEVAIDLLGNSLRSSLTVDVIAAPETYSSLAAEIFQWAGGQASADANSQDSADESGMYDRLLEATASVLESESQRVSGLLTQNFNDPRLHEQAAFLCGLMTLRENAGKFFDSRHSLNRSAAHLIFATALGSRERSVAGQLANVTCLLGMLRQADAVKALEKIHAESPPIATWLRVLRMRATGDYRMVDDIEGCRRAERVMWYRGTTLNLSTMRGWLSLKESERYRIPDYLRYLPTSIPNEVAQETTAQAIKRELEELEAVYTAFHKGRTLARADWKTTMNLEPGRCIDPQGVIRVISWGAWAWHSQRQLCEAIRIRHQFYANRWREFELANRFVSEIETNYASLALQPFLMLNITTNHAMFTNHVNRAMEQIGRIPQWIPSSCWLALTAMRSQATEGIQMTRSRIAQVEWFRHYPLPGTALLSAERAQDAWDRHASLRETLAMELAELAPYNSSLLRMAIETLHPRNPPPEAVERLYRGLSPYSTVAMLAIARAYESSPENYEKWILRAAELNPNLYFDLAQYYQERNDTDSANRFREKGFRETGDRVFAMAHAYTLLDHFLDRGLPEQAKTVAEEAGVIGTRSGLLARAHYHERVGELDQAFRWFNDLAERYEDPSPLNNFCTRHAPRQIESPLGAKLLQTLEKNRPKDLKRVTLADFTTPPTNGVRFAQSNETMREVGLRPTDTVVALNGLQILNQVDFDRLCETQIGLDRQFILWDGAKYRELKCSPPNRELDCPVYTYRPQ